MNKYSDLPVDFPSGTRFWQLMLDAVADMRAAQCTLSDGSPAEFILLDGSVVGGPQAEWLRRQVERDGVEISEEAFRQIAPPSNAELLKAIQTRADSDPEFAKALREGLAKEDGLLEKCEQVARDGLENAPDPEDRRESAKLLLRILAKKQNVAWQ
jgi:hypothetical protein